MADRPIPPGVPQDASKPEPRKDQGGLIGGLVLIVLGILFLANNLFPEFSFGDYWPVILIAIGAALLLRSRRGE